MILYCDTSALIKRYVEEKGTEHIDALWEDCQGVSTSVVAFAEAISAFSRKFIKEKIFCNFQSKFRNSSANLKVESCLSS